MPQSMGHEESDTNHNSKNNRLPWWLRGAESVVQETQEMQYQSQGQDYPLEEEMVTHSSILAW